MNKRILVINDVNPHPIIPELLIQAGYEVDVVSGTDEGLRHLENQACDAIIVLESPPSESWRTCRDIRNLTAIPLIIVSSSAGTEACVKAINAGADFFMRKSFGPLEFLARVNLLLQRTPQRQPVPVSS